MVQILPILLPSASVPHSVHQAIRPGSAIVGSRSASELGAGQDGCQDGWVIDIEGNLYGAENMRSFEGRLQSAAGRHVQKYPTTARLFVNAADMTVIGRARHSEALQGWIVDALDAPDLLAAWLDPEALPRVGGSADLWDRAAGRLLSSREAGIFQSGQIRGSWRDAAFQSIRRREPGLQPPS